MQYRIPRRTTDALHRTLRMRSLSTETLSLYHSKVRAFPFAFSHQDAIVELGILASIHCVFRNFLGSVGARFLPGFGFSPIQPTRIQAVYLPVWMVDAEVEAKVWLSNGEDTMHRTAVAHLQHAYMPGFTFEPLSRMPLNFPSVWRADAVPFTPDLAIQHDASIMCLPYTDSPFSVLGRVRSLSYSQATINENVRFDPATVKSRMTAAYPVLLPVYLAQYDVEIMDDKASETFVLAAHTRENAPIITEPFISSGSGLAALSRAIAQESKINWAMKLHERLESAGSRVNDSAVFSSFRAPLPRFVSQVEVLGGSTSLDHKHTGRDLRQWIDGLVTKKRDANLTDAGECDLAMDDVRVREFMKEETDAVTRWLDLGRQIALTKATLEHIQSLDSSTRVIHVSVNARRRADQQPDSDQTLDDESPTGADPRPNVKKLGPIMIGHERGDELSNQLKGIVRTLEITREKIKMAWLSEWEESEATRTKT